MHDSARRGRQTSADPDRHAEMDRGAAAAAMDGFILAGGLSSRMGRDKHALLLEGRTLLSRIAERMAPACRSVRTVVAGPEQAERVRAAAPELAAPVLEPYAGEGPLAGLHGAMLAAEAPLVWLAACDMPFVSAAAARRLAAALERCGSAGCAAPRIGSRLQPLHAVYRRDIALAAADRLLQSGERRLSALLEALDVLVPVGVEMGVRDAAMPISFNVNTPADYEASLRLAAEGGGE
ncbi:Molybdopterin-guanine dinucleotide biosynthesis protein MobA [Paenibacillus pasadenensis]|uniref:Probable molybdenum cofactor guanylyltransferase n=1 Tax=Paenibacillus pasadenensis TaxID=217090 RepID=A0A2N5NBR2_9BACL|nr:molybdenum cofactor guanylyltransferase [Paenibacillus pasadenensis]PLT47787.1 Molybdopterin-guanine dinucleotide biosynthesis protein MobA [Paenibacillus pasadenensis]